MDRNDAMQIVIIVVDAVALRKESVDRNDFARKVTDGACRSLSARRAWIEISRAANCQHRSHVALRKESVDRNSKEPPPHRTHRSSLSARRAWIEIELV